MIRLTVAELARRRRPARDRIPRERCAVAGCTGKPAGKPYCVRHVDQLDYPREVLEEARRRSRELKAAALGKTGAIDVQGTRAQELLDLLERSGGELRVSSIVRPLELDYEGGMPAAETYVRALERVGLVESWTRKTDRGETKLYVRLAGGAA